MGSINTTRTNFDWIAPVYDALAFLVFGRALQKAQLSLLSQPLAGSDPVFRTGASVLMVGGGTGWLLEQLLRQYQPARVLYLEQSARMSALASRRLLKSGVVGVVEFRVGDETALAPNEHFDVIITPFVLDLFTEQALTTHLIPKLLGTLNQHGSWLITDFVRTNRWWQQALLWSMIRFFRLTAGISTTALADWQACLLNTGLRRRQQQRWVSGMVASEIWERP